jgi:hypothetical protein
VVSRFGAGERVRHWVNSSSGGGTGKVKGIPARTARRTTQHHLTIANLWMLESRYEKCVDAGLSPRAALGGGLGPGHGRHLPRALRAMADTLGPCLDDRSVGPEQPLLLRGETCPRRPPPGRYLDLLLLNEPTQSGILDCKTAVLSCRLLNRIPGPRPPGLSGKPRRPEVRLPGATGASRLGRLTRLAAPARGLQCRDDRPPSALAPEGLNIS